MIGWWLKKERERGGIEDEEPRSRGYEMPKIDGLI